MTGFRLLPKLKLPRLTNFFSLAAAFSLFEWSGLEDCQLWHRIYNYPSITIPASNALVINVYRKLLSQHTHIHTPPTKSVCVCASLISFNLFKTSHSNRIEMSTIEEAKELICDLCRNLYTQGHVSGTGGGISIRVNDHIVMAPSGVQKERMLPSDMFTLDLKGNITQSPTPRPPPTKLPKLSECAPLFLSAYELRNAGAIIHGHSINAFLATLINPGATEFHVTNIEMIKGIKDHGFYGDCVVPIIENTARECELTDRLRVAIARYPKSNAVLVRRHGVYVWGDDWIAAKTQAESYEYLFEAAVRMHAMGMDASVPPPAPLVVVDGALGGGEGGEVRASKKAKNVAILWNGADTSTKRVPKAVVLDIEGTVSPLAFVKETMYGYFKDNLRRYLDSCDNLSAAEQEDKKTKVKKAVDMIIDEIMKNDELASKYSEWVTAVPRRLREDQEGGDAGTYQKSMFLMSLDSTYKSPSLKNLQGIVWQQGFESGQLKGQLYPDVVDALGSWHSRGIKTYIFSSGSRQAQKNFFKFSTVGDARPYICGYFDPTVAGGKLEKMSYENIYLSLGVDSPEDVMFATDNLKEAEAARTAGWQVVMVDRPGNEVDLSGRSEYEGFRVVRSMAEVVFE